MPGTSYTSLELQDMLTKEKEKNDERLNKKREKNVFQNLLKCFFFLYIMKHRRYKLYI